MIRYELNPELWVEAKYKVGDYLKKTIHDYEPEIRQVKSINRYNGIVIYQMDNDAPWIERNNLEPIEAYSTDVGEQLVKEAKL